MGKRRFEMHDYRHIISRMRLGESDRQIAKAGLMGCNKAADFREIANKYGAKTCKTLPNSNRIPPGRSDRNCVAVLPQIQP